jgi:hypothetical protein
MTEDQMKAVVSPQQISGLARLVDILSSSNIGYSVAVVYDDELVKPFDVRIHVSTDFTELWLYPDGADASGKFNIRLEKDDFQSVDKLFDNYLSKVEEFISSISN